MTKPERCRILGFEVLDEFDGFLKARGVFQDYTAEDLRREQQVTERVGF